MRLLSPELCDVFRISWVVLFGLPEQYHVVFGAYRFGRPSLNKVGYAFWHSKLYHLVKRKLRKYLQRTTPGSFCTYLPAFLSVKHFFSSSESCLSNRIVYSVKSLDLHAHTSIWQPNRNSNSSQAYIANLYQ